MKIRNTFVFFYLLLAGCNNFNSVHNWGFEAAEQHTVRQQPPLEQPPPTKSTVKKIERVSSPKPRTDVCPRYIAPAVLPTPELPIKELQALTSKNHEAVDRLMMKHIEDLRTYIANYKRTMAVAQANYDSLCSDYQRKKRK